MLELGRDVQARAMQRDPAAHTQSDARDFGPIDKNADLTGAPLAVNAEKRQGRDQPVFEEGDEGPDVAAARAEVEHDIDHALAGTVIGEAAPAPAPEHGEAGGR